MVLSTGEKRWWEKWQIDRHKIKNPTPVARLFFAEQFLKVSSAERKKNRQLWNKSKFLQTNATDRFTVITLFLMKDNIPLVAKNELSLEIGRHLLSDNNWLVIVLHHEPYGTALMNITEAKQKLISEFENSNISLPSDAYGYFTLRLFDESRAVVGVPFFPLKQ